MKENRIHFLCPIRLLSLLANFSPLSGTLPHGNVFQFVLIFFSPLVHFCQVFSPIQNMCSPLFTSTLTLLTKALRSKRREVFLFILGSCTRIFQCNKLNQIFPKFHKHTCTQCRPPARLRSEDHGYVAKSSKFCRNGKLCFN